MHSPMSVEGIDQYGSDRRVIQSMLVSTNRDNRASDAEPISSADQGRLNYLMKNKHATPFEHAGMTVLVNCSLSVRSEWQRHRTQSYNEMSFRYTAPNEQQLRWYTRPAADVRIRVGKPGYYAYETAPVEDANWFVGRLSNLQQQQADLYQEAIDRGIAPECARDVLGTTTMTKFYATANLRNWFNFLVLRNALPALAELRRLASDVEHYVALAFPACYAAWLAADRTQL